MLWELYSTKWEFDGTGLRPMGTPIGKTTDGSVLGAQTQGETHRQNDTSLAVRPKYTNPYPWRDPYRGGGTSRRPPLWIPLYGSLHGYGFVYLGRPASDVSFCLWISAWV